MNIDKAKHKEATENDQILLNERQQIERELSELSESLLDEAILKGLEQGKRRTVRGSRVRKSWQLGGALICIFMLLTGFIRVSPAFASIMKEIPGFSRFVELIEFDHSITTALENEFMQPIGVSVERNGFTMTVESIMADRQRLIIFYTLEGPGIDQNTDFVDYKVDNSDGTPLEALITSSHFYRDNEGRNDSKLYDYLDIMLDGRLEMPESIQFGLKPDEDWLETELKIDHERFANMEEHIVMNEPFKMAGQSFVIKDILITPLQVIVNFEGSSSAEYRANSFIDIALLDEKGRRYVSNVGLGSLDSEHFSRLFQSSYFEKPKELTLYLQGLYFSPKEKTFVINLDTTETLKTPDENIVLESVREINDSYELKIRMEGLDDLSSSMGYTFFEEQNTMFKDASGTDYPFLERKGTRSEHRKGEENVANYYYNIPKADYVQPLTFEVNQYPGYQIDPVSIRIK